MTDNDYRDDRAARPTWPGSKRRSPVWLLTYADMVTLLFCFFVMLLAFANTDAVKFKEVLGSMKEAFGARGEVFEPGKGRGIASPPGGAAAKAGIRKDRLVRLLETAVREEGLEQNVLIALHPRGVKMEITELAGNAMFKPGASEILPEFMGLLRRMLPIMQETIYKVIVEGHTDNVPVRSSLYPSNWELSSARAGRIVRFFIQEGKLNPRRFSALGLADTQPLKENDTPDHRAENRRVTIVYEVF
jgi:chemotaxis protein MotB